MTFDDEEALFDNIKSAHNGNYLIADTTWRFFLKIEGNKLHRCRSEKSGWCSEVPGELDKQFQFVDIVSIDRDEVLLKLKDKTKKVEVLNSDATHYYGR
jgi:hypothetical protein